MVTSTVINSTQARRDDSGLTRRSLPHTSIAVKKDSPASGVENSRLRQAPTRRFQECPSLSMSGQAGTGVSGDEESGCAPGSHHCGFSLLAMHLGRSVVEFACGGKDSVLCR